MNHPDDHPETLIESAHGWIRKKDGTEMRLIPSGEFSMGSDDDSCLNERPAHSVYVDAFYIDVYPVTVEKYCQYLNENDDPKREENSDKFLLRLYKYRKHTFIPRRGFKNYPVNFICWDDAVAYAQWTGARMPTEADTVAERRGSRFILACLPNQPDFGNRTASSLQETRPLLLSADNLPIRFAQPL